MAEQVTLGGDGSLFIGEDKIFRLELLDSVGAPVNMTGWTILFDIKRSEHSGVSLLSVAASITGTFNAIRLDNTQRAEATLTDTQTGTLSGDIPYYHSWKRTNDGNETILAYGRFTPQWATQT